MGKTEIQLLKERLILDNVSLRVRPFELDLAGYPIEMVALTAKGPYGNPVFSFVVRGLRIERIYDSYKLVFFYRTKKHNVEIEDAINEYFQPQMRLGFTGDKYEFLRSQIAMIHNDYSKDSKDTEIFVVDFQTVKEIHTPR